MRARLTASSRLDMAERDTVRSSVITLSRILGSQGHALTVTGAPAAGIKHQRLT